MRASGLARGLASSDSLVMTVMTPGVPVMWGTVRAAGMSLAPRVGLTQCCFVMMVKRWPWVATAVDSAFVPKFYVYRHTETYIET